MPIREYLHDGSFDPETTKAMGEAFVAVLKRLEALGRFEPSKDAVATFIINSAKNGEREAHRMTLAALTHFIARDSEEQERKQA